MTKIYFYNLVFVYLSVIVLLIVQNAKLSSSNSLSDFDSKPKCWTKHKGVCVSMKEESCPFSGGNFEFEGCPDDYICCIPPEPETPLQSEALTSENCGRSIVAQDSGEYKMVGGWPATHGEWPWQVSIKLRGSHICGGAIIDNLWILSAAHCFNKSINVKEYSIVSGETDFKKDEGTEQLVKVSKLLLHKKFNDPKYSHDIALLKLREPLKYNNYTEKICLPSGPEFIRPNMICSATGWGSNILELSTNALYEVDMPIIAFDKCKEIHKEKLHDHNFCAGFKSGGRDTCTGDSGGPMSCLEVGGKYWILGGLVSWGMHCGRENSPGIYTNVGNFLDWIKETKKMN